MHSCASVVMATIFTDCLLTVSQEKVNPFNININNWIIQLRQNVTIL